MQQLGPASPIITITSFEEKQINDKIQDLTQFIAENHPEQPVVIRVDSYGGSVFGLTALYEFLRTLSNPIITYTSSKAMSAGAILLSAAGNKGKRVMSPNSVVMVHELQASAFGDVKDIFDVTRHIQDENDKWMTILAQSMGLKNRIDIVNLIKKRANGHELYLDAKQAKEIGLVDTVGYLQAFPVGGWEIRLFGDEKPKDKKPKKCKGSGKCQKG